MVEDRRDGRDEIRHRELARRQVDAHHEVARRRVAALPLADLLARGLEHPAADRQDEARLLGERDERQRRHDAAGRVEPAQERLHADDPAGRELDDRLVVEPELGAVDGAPQVVLERRPVDGLGVHLGVEQDRRPDRVELRAVERDLRLLEQVAGVRDDGPPDREPEARADVHLAAAEVERLRDGGLDPRRDPLRLADAAHRAEEDAELVGAQPRDGVGGARRGEQPPADLDQQQVARVVAQALVDDLEPVEVEEDERDPRRRRAAARGRRWPRAAGGSELLGEAGEQQRPVRAARSGGRGARRGPAARTSVWARSNSRALSSAIDASWREPDDRLDLALAERP